MSRVTFLNRVARAKAETNELLTAALRYSAPFRKPAQIEFYRAHIAYLEALAAGEPCTPPTADLENWHVTACVLEARARGAA